MQLSQKENPMPQRRNEIPMKTCRNTSEAALGHSLNACNATLFANPQRPLEEP